MDPTCNFLTGGEIRCKYYNILLDYAVMASLTYSLDGKILPMAKVYRGYKCRMWDTLAHRTELGPNIKGVLETILETARLFEQSNKYTTNFPYLSN